MGHYFAIYAEEPIPFRTGHRTALMFAAAAGDAEAVRLLLQHKASVRERDAEGLTALDYARSEPVRILLQALLP